MLVSFIPEFEQFFLDKIRSGLSTTLSEAFFKAPGEVQNPECNLEKICGLFVKQMRAREEPMGTGEEKIASRPFASLVDVEPAL